jgi:hypothetical protein
MVDTVESCENLERLANATLHFNDLTQSITGATRTARIRKKFFAPKD